MVLLAAVLIYVLVTQLMLIPVRAALEDKANAVRDVLMDSYQYASAQAGLRLDGGMEKAVAGRKLSQAPAGAAVR